MILGNKEYDSGKNKSLIPNFGLLVIMTVCMPKVGIKLLFLPESLVFTRARILFLFPRIMAEFYSLFPYFL